MKNDISKSLLNLYGFKVLGISGVNPIEIEVEYRGRNCCPKCKNRNLRKKDKKIRHIRHTSIVKRKMYLVVKTIKFYCEVCKTYFWQRFQGVLPRSRNTEQFKYQIAEMHHDGITAKTLGKSHNIGHATVTRWYTDFLRRKNLELKGADLPKYLGIDEHFFTRRRGYATTFCNLQAHKVYDVAMGRSEASLERYLLSCKGRNKVQVVVIDLSETYRSISKKYFKNAQIVADRFHVIKLVNLHFMKAWGLLDETGRRNIGLFKLMRQHEWNLRPDKQLKLMRYLAQNPTLEAIYQFKQELCQLLILKRQNHVQFKKIIPKYLCMIKQLQESNLDPLITLGNTLYSWKDEIMRMLRFTKSNGITEGFHNKMEMMSRRAYGFRNFQNYRMKVRVACA